MSAAVNTFNSGSSQSIELATLQVINEELREELSAPVEGKKKGVSSSGKGGNQTSFGMNVDPQNLTAAGMLGGIAKTFLASTPQGRFNLLKQLGMPVEELNKALGQPEDSTQEMDSPEISNYFLEIASAMTASNNGNNASITAMLQQIASQQQSLNTVSDGLETQAQTANADLKEAYKSAHSHKSAWGSFKDFFTDHWKMIVITVAVALVCAVVPVACGALVGVGAAAEAADAAATAATVAEASADGAESACAGLETMSGQVTTPTLDAAQTGTKVAQQAAKIATEAANNAKTCASADDVDGAEAWNKCAQDAKQVAQQARNAVEELASTSSSNDVEQTLATEGGRIKQLETTLKTLKESVNVQRTADEATEASEKNLGKWAKFKNSLVRGSRRMNIARSNSATPVRTTAGQLVNKGLGVGLIPLGITVAQAASPSNANSEVLSAQLQAINSNTQVLTNQSQIINLNINTDQTQINNYNERVQADSQMVQSILSLLSQTLKVVLN
ncbi:MAG: hypothetical protein KBC64_01990 [Simkaniaceae bacterium]|nr:hypothetical protein [Simkaniaceae bacterium]